MGWAKHPGHIQPLWLSKCWILIVASFHPDSLCVCLNHMSFHLEQGPSLPSPLGVLLRHRSEVLPKDHLGGSADGSRRCCPSSRPPSTSQAGHWVQRLMRARAPGLWTLAGCSCFLASKGTWILWGLPWCQLVSLGLDDQALIPTTWISFSISLCRVQWLINVRKPILKSGVETCDFQILSEVILLGFFYLDVLQDSGFVQKCNSYKKAG